MAGALGEDDADRLTFHEPPAPLPSGFSAEAWPRFLGPRDDAKSREGPLAKKWPEKGPRLVWELEKGEGYTTPAMAEGRLILFHRWDGEERIECRDPETGKAQWTVKYPVAYRDQYGYSNGPRGSPVIDGPRVYTLGVKSMLSCVELASGKLLWQRDLMEAYQVPSYFFGSGSSPLIYQDLVIVNVGGGEPMTADDRPNEDRETVVAFDKFTGEARWTARSAWGASYASPLAASFHGKDRLLVFTGGKSRPPTGGLLLIDPATGQVLNRFPWRAEKYESVNATTPVVSGNRVFITETYRLGGVCLEVTPEDKFKEVWRAPDFAVHWSAPVLHEGHLYGFHGEREPFAELVCYDWETGKECWRDPLRWEEVFGERTFINSPFRGSLLHVDGRFLCLGEGGSLLWLDLDPKGFKISQRTQLFHATQTWSTPAIHRGLVYISQHYRGLRGASQPRLFCYDFRPGE